MRKPTVARDECDDAKDDEGEGDDTPHDLAEGPPPHDEPQHSETHRNKTHDEVFHDLSSTIWP